MAEDRELILKELEQSLINMLISQKNIEERVSGGARRVRSLVFNIDVRNINNPSFSVQIGIFEAVFSATNGLKERGNCFGLERHIRDWFERPSINATIQNYIQAVKHHK